MKRLIVICMTSRLFHASPPERSERLPGEPHCDSLGKRTHSRGQLVHLPRFTPAPPWVAPSGVAAQKLQVDPAPSPCFVSLP